MTLRVVYGLDGGTPTKKTESEVDPGRGDFLGLGHGMNPVMLGLAFHHKQAAVFKKYGNDLLGFPVLKFKNPLGAKTHGGDQGVTPEGLFIIAVPSHPFGSIMVKIQEAGIKPMSTLLLNTLLDHQKRLSPRRSGLAGSRVGIGKGFIPHPGNLAGEDSSLPEEHDFIILPGSRGQQLLEKII
jgi:hypothetical protein